MEDLKLRREKALKALATLEAALAEPFSLLVRDATIQRFEYTFESLWKFVRAYLRQTKGLSGRGPKDCFRELLGPGLLDETHVRSLLEMTDDRNLTSHTYEEELAAKIFSRVEEYARLMRLVLSKLSINP